MIHHHYAEMSEHERQLVDDAFELVRTHILENSHFRAANDDRAERLVEAIARYIHESGPRG